MPQTHAKMAAEWRAMRSPAAVDPYAIPPGYDPLGDMIEWESGSLNEAGTVRLFQHLVNTGMAWTLQGVYGRTASALIASGEVVN